MASNTPTPNTVIAYEWPELLVKDNPISKPKLSWRIGSRLVVPAVGILSKIWIKYLNTTVVHNQSVFLETLERHYDANRKEISKRALITICNHTSCMDDPLIWGALMPFKWLINSDRLRWAGAAQEVCFSNKWHSRFFALGKTFPIVRGKGIYQPAMDYAATILSQGGFLHVFPQGKIVVNDDMDKITDDTKTIDKQESEKLYKTYDLKWGLARLIIEHVINTEDESGVVEILAFHHIGMQHVLPDIKPYFPRVNKNVMFYVRPEGPIIIDKKFLVDSIKDFATISSKLRRIKLMEIIEKEMSLLRVRAIKVHNKYLTDKLPQSL